MTKWELTFTFFVKFSNSIPNWTTFVKEIFWFNDFSESDEMTAVWPNAAKLLLFIQNSQIEYQTEQLLKFLDLMLSFQSDKITAFWPNQRLTFTFYETFSNSIPNWTTFVKEFFDSMFSL